MLSTMIFRRALQATFIGLEELHEPESEDMRGHSTQRSRGDGSGMRLGGPRILSGRAVRSIESISKPKSLVNSRERDMGRLWKLWDGKLGIVVAS